MPAVYNRFSLCCYTSHCSTLFLTPRPTPRQSKALGFCWNSAMIQAGRATLRWPGTSKWKDSLYLAPFLITEHWVRLGNSNAQESDSAISPALPVSNESVSSITESEEQHFSTKLQHHWRSWEQHFRTKLQRHWVRGTAFQHKLGHWDWKPVLTLKRCAHFKT